MSEHVSQDQLRKLLELPDQFSSTDQASIDEHLLACPECLAVWETLLNDDDAQRWRLLQQTPHSEPMPFSLPATFPAETADDRFPLIPGYEILEELGRGTMGVVYKAKQTNADRVVALKMILAGSRAAHTIARFRTEVETLARLQDPNIVQVFEVGEHDGHPFFSFEYCSGGSLDRQLANQPLPAINAARLIETLARAMHKAHQKNVVHRDLKPANILLTEDGLPKIGDFGLARKLDVSGLTRDGAILGTPSYMAPEQATGRIKEHGPSVDIYSLGAVLYQCLTGHPPFQAATPVETLSLVLQTEPVSPKALKRGLPRDLETICLKCLRKHPTKRYGSALELAEDLKRFLEHEPIKARPVRMLERGIMRLRRRPLVPLAGLLAIILLVSSIGGWWLWHRNVEQRRIATDAQQKEENRLRVEQEAEVVHYEYYNAFAKRNGVPEGIGSVSEKDIPQRSLTYKFYRRNGQIIQMDLVNGHKVPAPFHSVGTLIDRNIAADDPRKPCSFRFVRDAKGELAEEQAFDRAGRLVWKFKYSSPSTAFFTDANGIFVGARSKLGASHVRIDWSPDGREQTIRYFNAANQPTADDEGVFGAKREYDQQGLVTFSVNLDAAGAPMLNRARVGGSRAEYDARGNTTMLTILDHSGQASVTRQGIHQLTFRHDSNDRLTEVRNWQPDGKAAKCIQGHHRVARRFNDFGDCVEEAFFDVNDHAIQISEGYHRIEMSYDDFGNCSDFAYFDEKGGPAMDRQGVARKIYRYDGEGNQVEAAFFGPGHHKQPLLLAEGFHSWKAHFDNNGRRTELSYFDRNNRPVSQRDGYHMIHTGYDEQGNINDVSTHDTFGQLFAPRGQFARWTIRYEPHGREIERAWFGANNKPFETIWGFARRVREYSNDTVSDFYFDAEGEATLHRDGYASSFLWVVRKPTISAQVMAFKDAANNMVFHRDGYAAWTKSIEPSGVFYAQADDRAQKVVGREGFASWKGKADDQGRLTEQEFFGQNDEPINARCGYAKVVRIFGPQSDSVRMTYFVVDGRGKLIPIQLTFDTQGEALRPAYLENADKEVKQLDQNSGGVWQVRSDERGNRVSVIYLDSAGRPALHPHGFHQWRAEFDADGQETSRCYFDIDGHPVCCGDGWHKRVATFGARNKMIEESYWDIALRPAQLPNGYHRGVARYDWQGNLLESLCFNIDGLPLMNRAGYARLERYYDGREEIGQVAWALDDAGRYITTRRSVEPVKNVESFAYFTADGQAAVHPEGYHRVRITYGDRNQPIETAYFDINGKPITNKNGYHFKRNKYDSGRLTEQAFFDTEGKPMSCADGWHKQASHFDKHGVEIERRYLAVDGTAATNREGVTLIERVAYFGKDGKPALFQQGNHLAQRSYDLTGKCVRTFFGLDGRPALDNGCVGREDSRKNEAGGLLELSYFDLFGRPTCNAEGFHCYRGKFDGKHRVESAYMGIDGKPTMHRDGFARLNWKVDKKKDLICDMSAVDVKGDSVPLLALIVSVEADGRGASAGLKQGDIVVSYDGKEVDNYAQLLYALNTAPKTETSRELKIKRGNQTLTVIAPPLPLGVTFGARARP